MSGIGSAVAGASIGGSDIAYQPGPDPNYPSQQKHMGLGLSH